MRKLLIAILIFLCLNSIAQEKSEKFSYKVYGFVRNEFYIDTYKGVDAAYDMFYLVPLYKGVDANGEDINEQVSSNFTAVATRIGLKIDGPEIFGAKTSANIETDFCGIVKTEPTLFRIRQANVKFDWKTSRLIIGQTWHPFWGGGVYPTVAGLNTGAPFQAFSRAPQIRYDIISGNFTISGSAVYENQYSSKAFNTGVYTTPTQAQRNGVLPEFVLSAEFSKKNITLGLGAQTKRIKPCMATEGTVGVFKSDDFLTSSGYMAYAKYKDSKLAVTAKAYYGQNMTHLTFLSGYAVATKDLSTGAETYTNYTTFNSLLNIVYGTQWQAGLMLGYGDNLGTDDAVYNNGSGSGIVAGLLPNVMGMSRVSPHIALNKSKFRIVAEYEVTNADYGVDGFNFENGLYDVKHKTQNKRFILLMVYYF